MHSFTSSSKLATQNEWERNIPDRNWTKLCIGAFIVFIVFLLSWEIYWRNQGYAPSIEDNKDLWAYNRAKVSENADKTVLIGASRMLFDFDLSVYKEQIGHEPIQLSTVGTNATYYLDDIANNSNFHGTLIMDVLPMLMFVPEGMPVNTPKGNIEYAKSWTWAQKWSFYLGLVPDKFFAYLQSDDLALGKLLARLPIQNRPDAKLPPTLPPYFMEFQNLNRQGLMTLKGETDVDFQNLIKNRWIPLFTPPPPPPIFTHEQFMKIFMDHVNATLVQMKNNIAKIQARGGKVILVRFPSTGKVRELEDQFSPNPAFYDRIKNETGANFVVSFEDYPELHGFDCPEWSHLNRKDATEFTKRLMGILKTNQVL